MIEYSVSRVYWATQPDPKKIQEDLDKHLADGWRLFAVSNATGSGGGSVLHYWERHRGP